MNDETGDLNIQDAEMNVESGDMNIQDSNMNDEYAETKVQIGKLMMSLVKWKNKSRKEIS